MKKNHSYNSSSDELNDKWKQSFHNSEKEFELKSNLYKELLQFKSEFNVNVDFNALFTKIWDQIQVKEKTAQRKKKIRQFRPWIAAAAVIIFVLLLNTLLPNDGLFNEKKFYTAISPEGSISQIILPDNTMVYLNAGTEIKYSVKGRREAYLDGEAYFKVTHDKRKPFVVHTSNYDVTVLGTMFNVKAYSNDNEVTTTLEKGLVQISSDRISTQGKKQLLHPGEQLVYNKSQKEIQVKKVDAKKFSSWKDNKLIFINENFKDLIVILERRFGVNIEVKDTELLEYHYDGILKNETIMEIMKIIKMTLPINYYLENDTIIIEKINN